MILDRNLNFVYANDAYLKSTHKDWEDLRGIHVFKIFPDTPDRVEYVHKKFCDCLAGEVTRLEAQPYNILESDGSERLHYWQATQEPILNENGDVVYLAQYIDDVTSRIEAEQERDLITQELNHRVKNVLSVIQSIARLSSRGQTSVESFTKEFIARVGAMNRVHGRLYENDFQGTSLKHILIDELEAMSVVGEDTFSLAGPEVQLDSKMSKDLSMVIHELATNAAKYGCFSKDDGRLDVIWTSESGKTRLIWRETKIGSIGKLSDKGFGSTLIRVVKNIDCVRQPIPDGLEVSITLTHP